MKYSCTQDMLLTAALGVKQLNESSCKQIQKFILGQQNVDGGYRGRAPDSDLYYTLFGMATSLTTGTAVDPMNISRYLESCGNGLDFVHLASLARCRASLPYLKLFPKFLKMADSPMKGIADIILRITQSQPKKVGAERQNPTSSFNHSEQILVKMEEYRASDGGYHQNIKNAEFGTPYAGFLAFLAYQDLGYELPEPQALLESISRQKLQDGSFANSSGVESGTTTATAAAVVLLAALGETPASKCVDSLLSRAAPVGGFLAGGNSPAPDLLSTATALYALKRAGSSLDKLGDKNYDFIESLWNEDGGFSGNIFDDRSDVEYTFYALLALGVLEN